MTLFTEADLKFAIEIEHQLVLDKLEAEQAMAIANAILAITGGFPLRIVWNALAAAGAKIMRDNLGAATDHDGGAVLTLANRMIQGVRALRG